MEAQLQAVLAALQQFVQTRLETMQTLQWRCAATCSAQFSTPPADSTMHDKESTTCAVMILTHASRNCQPARPPACRHTCARHMPAWRPRQQAHLKQAGSSVEFVFRYEPTFTSLPVQRVQRHEGVAPRHTVKVAALMRLPLSGQGVGVNLTKSLFKLSLQHEAAKHC